MTFKAFFFDLTVPEREDFADKAGSTRGLLTQVAYGNKRVELGFADVLVKLSRGKLTLDDVPLTENAARQRAIREGKRTPARESN